MPSLNKEWRDANVDPTIQKWLKQRMPDDVGLVYAIVKKDDGSKAYIGKHRGQTSAWHSRIRPHIRGPTKHQESTGVKKSVIHRAIAKYGQDAFVYIVLKTVKTPRNSSSGRFDESALDVAEVDAIQMFNTLAPNGYNLRKGGEGGQHHATTIAKIKSTKGTTEFRKACSERSQSIHSGKTEAERLEWNANIAKALSGARQRMSDAAFKREAVHDSAFYERRAKKANTTRDASLAKKLERALHDALPHQPDKSKRVACAMYFNKSGLVGCWSGKNFTPIVGQAKPQKADRVELAQKEALPYEPVKANRLKGKYYFRADGKIGRWDGFKLSVVCEPEGGAVPTLTNAQIIKNKTTRLHSSAKLIRIKRAREEALPYEPVKAKRLKGKHYFRQDGKIGRWDGFKLSPIE